MLVIIDVLNILSVQKNLMGNLKTTDFPAGADSDDKADSAAGLEEGSSEEPTPSLSGSQDVSSSTSGASRSPQVEQSRARDTPMEEKSSPSASLSHTCTNNSDSSSGTSNTNSSSNTSNSRSLFVPLARNGEGSDR